MRPMRPMRTPCTVVLPAVAAVAAAVWPLYSTRISEYNPRGARPSTGTKFGQPRNAEQIASLRFIFLRGPLWSWCHSAPSHHEEFSSPLSQANHRPGFANLGVVVCPPAAV